MRLLMTTDAVGGVWTYSVTLARALGVRGWNVTLAVLGPAPSAAQRADVHGAHNCELLLTGLPLDWATEDERDLVMAGETLARLASLCGADLVHLNSPVLAADAAFDQPVIGACHSCLASWWSVMRDGPMPPAFQQHRKRLGRGYAACSSLLAPSRSFADLTARIYGLRPAVVYNGAETGRRFLAEKQAGSILTAGRLWDEAKGLHVLARAAGNVASTIYAAGPLEAPHGGDADPGPIVHLGTLDDAAMADRLGRTEIFVSCSLYEPFGLTVLEAALAGCALVLSDIRTFRELWNGAALFVPPGNSEALAEALRTLAGAPEMIAGLGRAASLRASQYSLEKMVRGTEGLYRTQLPSFFEAKEVAA